jgi:hypothetical protein
LKSWIYRWYVADQKCRSWFRWRVRQMCRQKRGLISSFYDSTGHKPNSTLNHL